MSIKITKEDYPLLREYVEQQCSIVLRDSQQYLLEGRLQNLLIQNNCKNFREFYNLAIQNRVPGLREKIINAMTTNETFWFRDTHPWQNFAGILLPEWETQLKKTPGTKRIWSAAASTGQEAYSMSMLIDTFCRDTPGCALNNSVEIVGTDISTAALFVAIAGNYEELAMTRGFVPPFESFPNRYFEHKNKIWELSKTIRQRVTFKHFNLKDSFITLGKFDLICIRNVIIYFSNTFKEDLFNKIANAMNPGGYLLLGASETPIRYTSRFVSRKLGQSVYYQLKE